MCTCAEEPVLLRSEHASTSPSVERRLLNSCDEGGRATSGTHHTVQEKNSENRQMPSRYAEAYSCAHPIPICAVCVADVLSGFILGDGAVIIHLLPTSTNRSRFFSLLATTAGERSGASSCFLAAKASCNHLWSCCSSSYYWWWCSCTTCPSLRLVSSCVSLLLSEQLQSAVGSTLEDFCSVYCTHVFSLSNLPRFLPDRHKDRGNRKKEATLQCSVSTREMLRYIQSTGDAQFLPYKTVRSSWLAPRPWVSGLSCCGLGCLRSAAREPRVRRRMKEEGGGIVVSRIGIFLLSSRSASVLK